MDSEAFRAGDSVSAIRGREARMEVTFNCILCSSLWAEA